MKKNNSEIIFLVVSFLIIIIISLVSSSVNKLVFLNRASANELIIQIKLQGDYDKIPGANFKTKVVLYSQTGLVKEYLDQSLTHDHQSIFKLTIDTTGLNLSQRYAILIKPDKYLGKLFCSTTSNSSDCKTPQIIITLGTESLDLTQDPLFSGDVSPQDGKISADDISKIMKQIGQVSTGYLAADINSDGIVQTVDYSLALYSLSKNYIDDFIPSTWTAVTLTPTTGSTLSPTPTSTQSSTPTPNATSTPKPTKTPDVFPIDPSLVRQGTNTDEVFSIAGQKTCVPKEVLKGIAYIESGSFFDVVSPKYFLLYNSFNWWKSKFLTDVKRACGGYDYASNTGIIPADSNFAGQTCSGAQGGTLVAMGPLSVSDYWEGKYKQPAAKALGVAKTDQRVILDAIAIVGMSLKDNVKPANCNNWTAHEVAKAACSYYGSCGFKDGTYYCNTFCRNYAKFGGKTACQTAVNQMKDNCWK